MKAGVRWVGDGPARRYTNHLGLSIIACAYQRWEKLGASVWRKDEDFGSFFRLRRLVVVWHRSCSLEVHCIVNIVLADYR